MDNYSTDTTIEIARRYTHRIFQKGPERSAQINFGAHQAKGKYIYRVDSDFVVEKEAIRQCVEKCEKGNLDGIAVHNVSADNLGFRANVRKLERNCYRDEHLIVGLRFLKREIFYELEEFDESLTAGEDYDLHNRFVEKGYSWGRIKAKELHLGEPKSLIEIAKKGYFYGQSMDRYLKKHPKRGFRQINPIRGAYFRHWKTLVLHPVLLVGLVIMTAVKFSAGGIGLIQAKLVKTGEL